MRRTLLLFVLVMSCMISAKGGDSHSGYRGYMDIALGDAYNFNTAQTVSINNMQLYVMFSSVQGYYHKKWFIGSGIGYYYSCRDMEKIYPAFVASRYEFRMFKKQCGIESRLGIMYDPFWVEKVQNYGSFAFGVNVHKRLILDLRVSVFSRPSRFFTANAAVVVRYKIEKKL